MPRSDSSRVPDGLPYRPAVGIMLLTHPEREVRWKQLHIDCAGDEFAPGADGVFSRAPLFGFRRGRAGFCAGWFDRTCEQCGAATAFLSSSACR